MVFSSHLFVYWFLPAALLLYYLAPPRARNLVLTLVSFVFYGWANPAFGLLLSTTTIIDYVCGLALTGGLRRPWRGPLPLLEPGGPRTRVQKAALWTSIVTNLALLAFFKYFNFGVDSFNALVVVARTRAPAARVGAAHRAAPGDQLLHLPVHELRDRRLPRPGARGAQPHRLLLLRVDVPAARGRPDHPLLRGRRSAPRAQPHAGEVLPRRRLLQPGDGQEGAARQPLRQGRRPGLRRRLGRHARRLVGRRRLRLPDLLRLQRLLRHGGRAGPDARLRLSQELRLALQGRLDHRLLAPLAHLALDLAARLPLRAAGRQPQGPGAHLHQPRHHHAARRPLARGVVELRDLGRPARCVAGGRARRRQAPALLAACRARSGSRSPSRACS